MQTNKQQNAEQRAQEQYEYEHQTDMISQAHDFVHSEDIQKQNSAEAFLTRSKYQKDTCEQILDELKEERKAAIRDIDFPLSAFNIMKRSLEDTIKNTTSSNTKNLATDLLARVESVLAGNMQTFSPHDLQELNRIVLTLYSRLVTSIPKGSQEDRQWNKANLYLIQYATDTKVLLYNVTLRK